MNRKPRRAELPGSRPVPQNVFAAALQLHQAGDLKAAEQLYRKCLQASPRHADSLHLLGVIAHAEGNYTRATGLIDKAIAINGDEATYHSNLGTALWKQGRLEAAVVSYRRALELRPDYAQALFNLATVWWKQGRSTDAETQYRAALAVRPNYCEAWDNLGSVLKQRGDLEGSITCYRNAIAARPDYPEAHNNLGTVLLELGRTQDAVGCYRKALDLRPDYPAAHFNLATAIWELGHLDAAIAAYHTALALQPDNPDVMLNLGTALQQLGRLDEAEAAFRRALACEPDHPEAHSNLGIVLLAQGEWDDGWRQYEWRWQTPQLRDACRHFVQPQWRGETAAGKTLLIHAEQGFGDTLQFCRYAALAAKHGLRVILETPQSLVRLLRGLECADDVIARGDVLPDFDLHCPMLSLPLALGMTLADLPQFAPYLFPDALQVAAWNARLAALAGPVLRVGVAWAGSPRNHSRQLAAVDQRRSLPADRLAPLFGVSGITFVSLQKGGPRPPAEFPLIDVMDEMADFADTAALIANLDLVISVDTAVVHLASAVGKPVWLMDRSDACWRWLRGRRDSPWYPHLRIYRQPTAGDWDSVIFDIVKDLRRLFKPSLPTVPSPPDDPPAAGLPRQTAFADRCPTHRMS